MVEIINERVNMKELLEAVENATNVRCIIYDTKTKLWIIKYKNKLKDNVVPSDILIDFLNNA